MVVGSGASLAPSGTGAVTANTLAAGTYNSALNFSNASNTYTGNTFVGTSFSGSGASLTNLNAGSLSTGTVASARLGSGTADNTTFLRGDGAWASPSSRVSSYSANNATLTVACPAGKVALGGGASSTQQTIKVSYPTTATVSSTTAGPIPADGTTPTAWTVIFNAAQGSNQVFVVCTP
jgi:hypothetical protein